MLGIGDERDQPRKLPARLGVTTAPVSARMRTIDPSNAPVQPPQDGGQGSSPRPASRPVVRTAVAAIELAAVAARANL
jgi:hypothetical protein